MCFPWARRMSHDEEELCQSCGQAVIPQMDGKVYKEHAVAGLEILSPRNLLSPTTPPRFRKELFSLAINLDKNLLKTFPASRATVSLAGKPIRLSFVFDPHPDPPSVIADSAYPPITTRSPPHVYLWPWPEISGRLYPSWLYPDS